MGRIFTIIAVVALAIAPAPALADDAAPLPEGSHMLLFGLGLAGVIIGRRASRRPGGHD